MLGKLFSSEEVNKAKEELEKKRENKRLKKEQEELQREAKVKQRRLEKEAELEKKRLEALAKEAKAKRLEEYILKITKEEVIKPGTHNTTIKIATNGEGLLGIDKRADKIEKWINEFIIHRSQIINISAKRDKGYIDDYIVTYWEVVVPKDWDLEYEKQECNI